MVMVHMELETAILVEEAGGGAGAGIGGNGGKGGNANGNISNEMIGSGHDGESGEDCGNINIYNSVTVYAYGGAGGASVPGTNAYAGTGGGGYPAAGIGGGGAGGRRWRSCFWRWRIYRRMWTTRNCKADNGLTANLTPFYGTGGAYFSSGKTSGNYLSNPETFAYIGGQGSQCSDWNSQGGDGGIAGQGGNIKVSEQAKIYAYNGNKYTDGTEYRNGENQLEIYCQKGTLRKVYKYDIFWNKREYRYVQFFKELFKEDTVQGIDNYISSSASRGGKHNNYLIRDEKGVTTLEYQNAKNMSKLGIGSGAGYIELSNGTYIKDNSMN